MKFFNYERIYLLSHGKPKQLVQYFREEVNGTDFIVNPKAIVDNFWVSDRHKAEYIGLCSLRNYEDYQFNGSVDLDLEILPLWIPKQVIVENPLVTLTETKILFNKEK